MMIHQIRVSRKACTKPGKRLGRGESSGTGKTSGRGHKGAGQRSGRKHHATHQGGQMPYFRRIPKRGFSNENFRVEYVAVNLDDLERKFEANAMVDIQALAQARLISNTRQLVKILGRGKLAKPLKVSVHKFSASAAEAVKAAGGEVQELK